MTIYPSLTGKELIAALKREEFIIERQRGSHVFMRHPDGRATVIPVHSGETIGPGLLSKILRDAEMTRDDLIKLLKKR
jgi:predicted RNA binding protein YcfA (HicA-like mRNA interferase family)